MLCVLRSIESFVGSMAGNEEEVVIFFKAFILFPWGKGAQAFFFSGEVAFNFLKVLT